MFIFHNIFKLSYKSKLIKEYLEVYSNNMDEKQHGQATRVTSTPAQPYPLSQGAGPSASSPYLSEQPYAPHYIQQLQQQELEQKLIDFWTKQYQEIEGTSEFRSHSLPLARIKKIMKADEEVSMISAEAPILFAKACEMFILELTMRAWVNADENKRRTLQKNDIAAAIARTDVYDFLLDVVPKDATMDHDVYAGISRASNAAIENVPYDYKPPQQVTGTPYGASRVVMGNPIPPQPHYAHQIHPFGGQVWPKQENHSPMQED